MLGDLIIWLSAALGLSASVYIVATATVVFARFLRRRSRAHA
jgi:hypothetical protein